MIGFDEKKLKVSYEEESGRAGQEGSILIGERVGESLFGSPNLGQRLILAKPVAETVEKRNILLYGTYMALVILLMSVLFVIFPTDHQERILRWCQDKIGEIACSRLSGEFLSVSINYLYQT